MKRQPPQTGAIALAFRTYFAILPVILLATALSVGAHYALAPFQVPDIAKTLIDSAITAVVAFAAHNYVVTGGKRSDIRALLSDEPGAFSSFLALSFIIILAAHELEWLFNNAVGPYLNSASLSDSAVPSGLMAALSIGLPIFLIVAMLVIIGGFGTMFPAIVDGGDSSPAAAWNRKVKGPIAYRIVGAMVIMLFFSSVIGLGVLPMISGSTGITFSWKRQLIFEAIPPLLSFYFATLVATILSKAYLGSYVGHLKRP